MKILILWLVFFCVVASATAQKGRANYKLAQKFEKAVEAFENDLTVAPQFINGTDRFWYRYKNSKDVKYWLVDPAKRTKVPLVDVEELLKQISKITGKEYKTTRFYPNTLKFDKTGQEFTFYFEGHDYKYNLKSQEVIQLPKTEEKENLRPYSHVCSPDSTLFMYAYKHNLYIYGNKDKGMDTTLVQLTTDGERYNSYAKSSDVSDKEHTAPRGRWLKNSKLFLVDVEDESKVGYMSVTDMTGEPRPVLKTYKYSVAGDSLVTQCGFKLIDVAARKVIPLDVSKWKDQSLTYLYSNRAGNKFYFYRTKRTWDERELCMYDLSKREVKVLIHEVDKPYFDYVIDQTRFINDGKEIILRSERTGKGHFYLYDGETGRLKRAITRGDYVTGQMHRLDTAKRVMYFYAFGKEKDVDPYYYMLYSVHLDKGDVRLLTPGNANHKTTISPSGKYICDNYSRVDMEPRSVLRDRSGKEILVLETPDLDSIYAMGWRKPERFCLKAADDTTDLYGVMWKPMDFDSTKRYPIISEVYPGPQFEYVPTSFCLQESYASALAQLGFIVIQTGHRGGTPLRGKAYQRYGFANMRDYPLADDKAVISQLGKKYAFIDTTKVGIFGHSGGGAMSVAALCTYPDFYTAAVAGAGNHDNRIYNTGWIELNNGVKEIFRDSLKRDSVIGFKSNPIQTNMELAAKCKGYLLLAHGVLDDNVNPAHTIRMAKALIDAGKNFELVLLPKSKHGFFGDEGKFFTRKMWRHFAKYLLEDSAGDYQSDYDNFD